jgi:hypothetical protein
MTYGFRGCHPCRHPAHTDPGGGCTWQDGAFTELGGPRVDVTPAQVQYSCDWLVRPVQPQTGSGLLKGRLEGPTHDDLRQDLLWRDL